MTIEDKQALKELILQGRNCNHLERYKNYYFQISGKHRSGSCTNCECNWLWQYLKEYVRENKL